MKAIEAIPLSSPDITEAEIQAVVKVLRNPRLSLGPVLGEFEDAVAKYVGVDHAVAVNSGTSGLHLALLALGIGEGDEVIVPSFTFIAAANAIRYVGARPVFVDVERETLNIDPARIEEAITHRTRALMVVHTFGLPAEMDELLAIARRHRLLVIEDACEALGAEYRGRKAGSLGDAGVFAFYPNKQITTGEGGMVVTNDAAVAATVRSLRNQGRRETDDWFEHTELGYNYRLSELNCALGVEQMRRIDGMLAARERVALTYERLLAPHAELALPVSKRADCRISWFVYVLRLNESFSRGDRDRALKDLAVAGIGAGRYFAPIHLQPAYREYRSSGSRLPITESESARTIALPFFNRLTEDQIRRVCDELLRSLASIKQEL